MSAFLSNLYKIDFFGKPFIFEKKNHNKFTTTGGLVFTCFIILTCIVIGFLFGKEIYERKYPIVITSDSKIDLSRVNTNEIPIFFGFIDTNAKNVPITRKHIKMEITLLTVSRDLQPALYFYAGFKLCKPEDFVELYQQYVKDILNIGIDLYCINQDDLYFQNDFISANSAYINVRFCNPNKYDYCSYNEEEYQKMMDKFFVITVLVDSFADPNSYKNPINYFVKNSSLKKDE